MLHPDIRVQIAENIKLVVNASGPIKGVDLALKVLQNLHPYEFESREFLRILDSLVQHGEILEVEYLLPSMRDRVKSLYFPIGTAVKVITQEMRVG